MSYQINQRISPSLPQPSMGINVADLDNLDSEKIKQGINSNTAVKIADQDNPAVTTAVTLPIWAGMMYLMAKFNDGCAGKYEDSFVGKIGKWGDKISNKIIPPHVDKAIGIKINTIKTFLDEKIINKSKILYAFFKTRTVPVQSVALMQSKGTVAELSSSIAQVFKKFTSEGNDLEKVMQLGFIKEGKADLIKYKDVVENSHTDENIKVIMDACKKQGLEGVYKIKKGGNIWGAKKLFGSEKYLSELLPFTKPLFCRDVHFSEFVNKLNALKGLDNAAHTTTLGKLLPKITLRNIEGLTNASAGAGLILGTLMSGFFIADAILKSSHAPKKEKGKTFAEHMSNNLAFYLTMPLAMKIMHGFGGLKYIGMSKEQVDGYRTKLTKFNKAVENRVLDKATCKNELNILKDMLKGDTKLLKSDSFSTKILKSFKNLIFKPLKWCGSIVTVGLEAKKGYIPKTAKGVETFLMNLPFNLKRGAGYPVRFVLFLAVIAPQLAKIAVKASHLIFGKPTKSLLDEEPEAKQIEESKTSTAPVMPKQQIQPSATMQPLQQNNENLIRNQVTPTQKENLVDMYKTGPNTSKSMMASLEPARTYIPSTEGVKVQSKENDEKNDKLNTLMGKADRAEMVANKYIVGKH